MMARKPRCSIGYTRVQSRRFNGAAPMMARKLLDAVSPVCHIDTLQWSRANDGAETKRDWPTRARYSLASMEPRQ